MQYPNCAVIGEYGNQGPIIAIIGEFDALPGLSQEAGIVEQKSIQNIDNGHGCGHNLLGAAFPKNVKSILILANEFGLFTELNVAGCQLIAASTSLKPPSRAIYV